MNRNRIDRRAARIGEAGKAYLYTFSDLRTLVRDYSRERGIGYQPNSADRPVARRKVWESRRFWLGDKFSKPVAPAAQAALRVACDMVGSIDLLAFRAAVMPGYYGVLAAHRREERSRATQSCVALAELNDREGRN
ncbi:hypothetical protein [Achromobacter denitrificans]|uniref:hypothetical protein n=1 Tax=Achromobacter denitrificans TaxID=32002 RepID=UPI000F67ADB3|nr:hypothetical protein [Achromobacter denitrificans]RSE85549.1 hypothetical protein EGU64_12665 [Achromobacter denitrificans]